MDDFEVDFDMKFSHVFTVKAKNVTEAKKKAFKRFESLRNRRAQYNISVYKR